jgi:hypothetical protein
MFRLIIYSFLVVSVLGPGRLCKAAPITLYFEATIADGENLPFGAHPGDAISGTFSYQSGSPGPIYPQIGSLNFALAGTMIEVPQFQIQVAHDQLISIDVPGRIAEPNKGPDVDGGPNGDSIVTTCLDGGPLFCGGVAGHNNLAVRPSVVFSEPSLILESSDLIGDANVWNLFSRREMQLMLGSGDTGRVEFFVGAYIGTVRVVPELQSVFLCLVASLVFGHLIHRQRPVVCSAC